MFSTNIKTTLPMLVQTIEAVKNVSIGYIGRDGLFDSATVKSYVTSLQGLSATQAEVVLSSAGMDKAQRKQIISALEATAATKTLTSEEAMSAMTRKLGTAEAAKELLIKSKLVTADQLEAGAEFKVSTEKLKSAVASGVLTQSEADNIAIALGLTGTNIGLIETFKLLAASIWANVEAMAAWLFTTPAGWATLAIGAIVGLTAAYIKWGDTLENTREKLSDLKNECQTIESDLSSMNDELKTTVDRMNELAQKDTLTFTEQEEYDNLVKSNNELQRKIDLLELEQELKNKEMNKTFVQTMTIDTENPFEHEVNPDGKKSKGQYGISDEYLTDETGYIEAQFKIRKQLLDDLAKAETEDERNRIQKRIDEINSFLTEKNKEWNEISDGISYISEPSTEDEKAVNEWLDYIADFQDKMAIEMGGKNAKTNAFGRLVDNWHFDETVQVLQTLGKQGRVTADMLNDPKYDEFINKLVELGVIDSAKNLDEIAVAFNNFDTTVLDTSETVDTATYSIYTFKTATEDLKSTLDDTFDAQSTIQSAFDKITEGTALSAEEVRELIAIYPTLADGFTKTVDGYTIDSQRLIDANSAMVADTKKSYEERIQYLKDFINTPFDTSDISSEAEARMYQTWAENVESAKTELSELELILSMLEITLGENTDDITTLSKKYADLSSAVSDYTGNQKTLNDALEEQKEHGQLSASTIQSLTEAGYAQALAIDAETGAVTLNVAEYEKLNLEKKKQIQLDIAKLKVDLLNPYKEENAAIADLERSLSSLNAEERKATQVKIAQMRASMASMALSEEETEQKEQELKYLEAQLAALDAPTFGNSDNEELIDVTNFKKALAEKEHLLVMEQITEEEFYTWLDSESERVYGNLADYQNELWKHEEEIYKWRKDKRQEEIDSEKEYIESLKDEYSEMIDSRIDEQEKLAESIEKAYDDKISAIDKEIDAINKVSEAEERHKDILDAEKSVMEAQKKLQEASIKNRLTYVGNGAWEARQDTDAIEEAKSELEDAKNERDKAYQENHISALEEQKELLETQKDNASEYYDNVVKDLEQQKTDREKTYDTLIDIYDEISGEKKQTTSNTDLVKKLTDGGDISKAVQGLSPTELQQAFKSGILTTDSNGNYTVDYSVLDNNTSSVAENTTALNNINDTLNKFVPKTETANDKSTAGGFNLVADENGNLTKRPVYVNGKAVEGQKVDAVTKTEWDSKKNFGGYGSINNLVKAIQSGEFKYSSAVASQMFNNNVQSRIGQGLAKMPEYVNNVFNNDLKPEFNCVFNIEGSMDKKTMNEVEHRLDSKFIEYTQKLTNAVTTSYNKQMSKI